MFNNILWVAIIFIENFLNMFKLSVSKFVCWTDQVSMFYKCLKVGLSPSKKNCFIYLNESPLKMMKNAFYFILKALFILTIFKFLSWLWSCRENGLIRKIRLISNFMTSQSGYQTMTIHILPISHEVKVTRQWNMVS